MIGPQAEEIDWENMMKKELHDKFQQMLSQQVEDVMATFGKALERIDDVEKTNDTKFDAKFDEVLARLPEPPTAAPVAPLHDHHQQQQQQQQHRLPNQVGRALRVPLEPGQNSGAAVPTVGASVAPSATADMEDNYEDEVDQNQNYVQPPAPPPPVVLMHIIAMAGLHHHLRYEIMTIFLN